MTLQSRAHDTEPRPAKLTAKDFWLLADSGAFAHHARTELIEGEIWVVNSVHRWHARVMAALHLELARAIGGAGLPLEVLLAGSVSMSDDSVPEPDLSVIEPLDPDADTIARDELKIAVEISDSTAEFDLGRKARLYARHGVPEYWVIHRERREVVQMWGPEGEAYAERQEVKFGERLSAATIDGLTVETARLG
jgi:Uma2 family endonuclease